MLRKILSLIINDGVVHYRDIARTLSIPQPLVEQMVWELERLGYLNALAQGCTQSKCAGCPMKCGASSPLQKAFVLTRKGREFLEKKAEPAIP